MKRPITLHILTILTIALLCSATFGAKSSLAADAGKMQLTPQSIMQHIKNDGARFTVNRLKNETSGDKTNYEWVILKIESGELVWLEIANAMLPGLEPRLISIQCL